MRPVTPWQGHRASERHRDHALGVHQARGGVRLQWPGERPQRFGDSAIGQMEREDVHHNLRRQIAPSNRASPLRSAGGRLRLALFDEPNIARRSLTPATRRLLPRDAMGSYKH